MKVRFTLFLLVCILASCQRNADIESVELPASKEARTALPKISKDIESLSVSDAVKVADIFTNGGVLTKSGAQKNVKSVVPVKGAAGEPLMYAVNYDDGYTIVSATKKYHPVLVSVDHGSYTGEPTGTGHAWVCDSYYATNYQTDYHLYVIPMGMGEITEMISPYSTIVYPEDLQIFLYYHMNFGWEGASDGYYFRDNVGAYSANRKNLIISRL